MTGKNGKAIFQGLFDKDRPDIVLAFNERAFTFDESDGGDIVVHGWFITENLIESRQMLVKTSAFDWDGALDRFNGRILYFHDQSKEPVGELINMTLVKDNGIKGSVRLWKENSALFKRAVKSGMLNAFSIGFTVDTWEFDEETEIVTILKARLKEISVVNIGADEKALFEVKNSLKDSTEEVVFEPDRSVILSDKNVPRDFNLEEFAQKNFVPKDEMVALQNMVTDLRENQEKLAAGTITKTELSDRMEKMAADIDRIAELAKEAKAKAQSETIELAYQDYRSLITEFSWLTDDDGNKLPQIHHKAHCLFQMPVNYDAMAAGDELRNLRDLYDATLLADAMAQFKERGRYKPQNLKLFQQLIKATERFDKDVALAMAGGNTGYGAEWLPQEMSAEFNGYLRAQPNLPNKFMLWNMPKGASAKFPFQNGKAVVYKGSEALVDNAQEARKTNVATSVKLFTPDVFIGALVSSEELTEDTILDMVGFIRQELATALAEGLESAIINGDDSTTHQDNTGTTLYQTYNVETCFKGLRYYGLANGRDIETASATTGVGALEIVNFTDAKGDMGVAGLNPSDCIYVTGIKGKGQVQNALFKEDALGVLAFMISGQLPTIDGSEIYISGQHLEQLQSTGIYHVATDVKHTSMECVHLPSFRLAQRRGVTLEFNKNILTQQQQFVATARWDFGKVSADAINPVAGMYNIQHTT